MAYRVLDINLYGGEAREYEPIKRTIVYGEYGEFKPYFLQFPYLIFYHHKCRLQLAFADSPIKSGSQMVFKPTLGNIYEDRICGCDHEDMDKSLKRFWDTIFTDDGCCYYYAINSFCNFNWFYNLYLTLSRKPTDGFDCVFREWSKITKKKDAKSIIFNKIRVNPWCSFRYFVEGAFAVDDVP